MSAHPATTAAYFDECWALGDDPWAHGTRWYERRKYDLTIAALPRARYTSSFEPGCGPGFLTQRLAARSEDHLAMERHEAGVQATRQRCEGLPTVGVEQGAIPDAWPPGRFDLIVLSEVLYYLDDDDLDRVLAQASAALVTGGDLIAVHYRPPVADHAWTGDEVQDRLVAHPDWTTISHVEEREFRLDVVRR